MVWPKTQYKQIFGKSVGFQHFWRLFGVLLGMLGRFWRGAQNNQCDCGFGNIPNAPKHAFTCVVWSGMPLNRMVYHRFVQNAIYCDFHRFLAFFMDFFRKTIGFRHLRLKLNVIMDLKNIPEASKHAFECLVWRETPLNHLVYHRFVENANFWNFHFWKFWHFHMWEISMVFHGFWSFFEKPMGLWYFWGYFNAYKTHNWWLSDA